jgi:hypothetical protein
MLAREMSGPTWDVEVEARDLGSFLDELDEVAELPL